MQRLNCGGMWIDGEAGASSLFHSNFPDAGSSSVEALQCWVEAKYLKLETMKSTASVQQDISSVLQDLLQLDAVKMGDLAMELIREVKQETYTVRTIVFQSQVGVFVPANLYIPRGEGPFPAVLNSHGHWENGKMGTIVQQTAQRLASAGYVVLCMDAWGAGERSTNQQDEYHGANLGASLFDSGSSLLAMHLLDNHQGVNLLCSLPFVAKEKIAAVGASGGGNQTLWITAYDKRIKAAIPVVSVGTFRGYLLQRNCVCELLPAGLSVLEAHDVLASIAPRPVQIFSALQEDIPAFEFGQMMKAYERAKDSCKKMNLPNRLTYRLFDEQHDFSVEMQQAAIDFFDEQFGKESTGEILGYSPLSESLLRVGDVCDLSPARSIKTTIGYLSEKNDEAVERLKRAVAIEAEQYKMYLRQLLSVDDDLQLSRVEEIGRAESTWTSFALTTTYGRRLRLFLKKPAIQTGTQLIVPAKGIRSLTDEQLAFYGKMDEGIALLDVFGMEEQGSAEITELDKGLPAFHTLSRTLLWLGETLIGCWVAEIKLVMDYLHRCGMAQVEIVADRETALAALCYQALYEGAHRLMLSQTVLSLVPTSGNKQEGELNMAIHIPGIIPWGDVSLLRALINNPIVLDKPIDLAGGKLSDVKLERYDSWVSELKSKIRKRV